VVSIEVELKRITATLKKKPHIQRVATFQEVTDNAQSDSGVSVWISIGSFCCANRFQHRGQPPSR